jgi:hypothetical protein
MMHMTQEEDTRARFRWKQASYLLDRGPVQRAKELRFLDLLKPPAVGRLDPQQAAAHSHMRTHTQHNLQNASRGGAYTARIHAATHTYHTTTRPDPPYDLPQARGVVLRLWQGLIHRAVIHQPRLHLCACVCT